MGALVNTWILFSDRDYSQIRDIQKQGFWKHDDIWREMKCGDICYIYSHYFSKIRFKAVVSKIENSVHCPIVFMKIVNIYRGQELGIADLVPDKSQFRQVLDITQNGLLIQDLNEKIEKDRLEYQQKVIANSTKEKKKDDPNWIFILLVVIGVIVVVGIVVLITLLLNGGSLLFAVCAFIGILGMVFKELF